MLKLTVENMRHIYLSGREVRQETYIPNDIAYLWDGSGFYEKDEWYIYLVSPKSFRDYRNFVDKLEKECPLLAELR